jgi:hypothetical protein
MLCKNDIRRQHLRHSLAIQDSADIWRMKPRHAGALALMGWCLMLPPSDEDLKPHPDAPLYQWRVLTQAFSTLADCQANKASMEQLNSKDSDTRASGDIGGMLRNFGQALKDAQCIKTDDPRLQVRPSESPTPAVPPLK